MEQNKQTENNSTLREGRRKRNSFYLPASSYPRPALFWASLGGLEHIPSGWADYCIYKGNEITILREICTLFISALVTMDIYQRIYMCVYVYIYCILFSHEKGGNLAICDNTDEP